MYDYIKGRLEHMCQFGIIIDCNDIGYQLNVTERWQKEIRSLLGKEIIVYTYMLVKENEMILYGFPSREERECFGMLISFSGVGPKTALSILNTFSLNKLSAIAQSEDVRAIASVPGIGKKTAEKLIVDFKQKLIDLVQIKQESSRLMEPSIQAHMEEGVRVLVRLGYKKLTAENMLKLASEQAPDASLEALIPIALKFGSSC